MWAVTTPVPNSPSCFYPGFICLWCHCKWPPACQWLQWNWDLPGRQVFTNVCLRQKHNFHFPTERPSDIEKAFPTQGGLMMRGVVQRCPQPPMRFVQLTTDKGHWHCFYPLHRNLVTFGSPHQGVFGIPECEAEVPAAPEFFLLSNIFTQGGKSPSVWVGAPTDLAWCIRALDPGLQFLQNSFICKTRLNRTLWPQRSIGMTPSTRPTSWY